MGRFRTDPNDRNNVHPDDVMRVDREILLGGPVALYRSSDRLDDHIRALESLGYRCPSFACDEWISETAMHRDLARTLEFPDYYGHNLDALNDCVGCLDIPESGGAALVLHRFDRFVARFPEVAWNVLDIVASAAWHHLQYGRFLLGLAQSDDPALQFRPVGAHPVRWLN